jgi:hypothetical protein
MVYVDVKNIEKILFKLIVINYQITCYEVQIEYIMIILKL